MHDEQRPAIHALIDQRTAETSGDELPPCHDAMLPFRKIPDQTRRIWSPNGRPGLAGPWIWRRVGPVPGQRANFTGHVTVNLMRCGWAQASAGCGRLMGIEAGHLSKPRAAASTRDAQKATNQAQIRCTITRPRARGLAPRDTARDNRNR
jgi:hypothetical protein